MNEQRWKLKKKPASLEARFEFEDFETLRTFLDDMAEKSEHLNHHPNISFGREHVSVIIYSQAQELQDVDFALADGIDEGFSRVNLH